MVNFSLISTQRPGVRFFESPENFPGAKSSFMCRMFTNKDLFLLIIFGKLSNKSYVYQTRTDSWAKNFNATRQKLTFKNSFLARNDLGSFEKRTPGPHTDGCKLGYNNSQHKYLLMPYKRRNSKELELLMRSGDSSLQGAIKGALSRRFFCVLVKMHQMVDKIPLFKHKIAHRIPRRN